ncbi:MAG TPA: Ku protein [Chitinophagaceae bacterium]|jgi:DNA end-binding protein Ku|nr:Ku protein [Chitinophagaceae bacterium]
MRAIWSGAISFGLVNIPVKLYSGTSAERALDLDMLSKKDMSPIRYARISTATNKEVEWKDIVKGYEVEKGKYVVITDEDFKKASPEKTNTIEILQFVNEKEIDSIYFEKPYYLVPDKGAAKPYTLLMKALEKANKVAIATCVIRNREHIFSIKPLGGEILLLEQLRYADQINEIPDVKNSQAKVTQQEINLALKLIDQLTEKFKPESFKDTYTDTMKKLIEAKAKGKKIAAPAVEKKTAAVKDLMSVLKESLHTTSHGKKKVA